MNDLLVGFAPDRAPATAPIEGGTPAKGKQVLRGALPQHLSFSLRKKRLQRQTPFPTGLPPHRAPCLAKSSPQWPCPPAPGSRGGTTGHGESSASGKGVWLFCTTDGQGASKTDFGFGVSLTGNGAGSLAPSPSPLLPPRQGPLLLPLTCSLHILAHWHPTENCPLNLSMPLASTAQKTTWPGHKTALRSNCPCHWHPTD